MSELYKKLAILRDENRKKGLSDLEDDIFVKLLTIAFLNKDNPDELPNEFMITDILMSQPDFEALMKKIDLDVTILPIQSFSIGNNFKVTKN